MSEPSKVRADIVSRLVLRLEDSSLSDIMPHMRSTGDGWMEMDPDRPSTPHRAPTFDIVPAIEGPTLAHCSHRRGATILLGTDWLPDASMRLPPRVVVEDCVLPDTLCDVATGLSLQDVALLPPEYQPLADAKVLFIGSEAGADAHTRDLVIHIDPDFQELATGDAP